MNSHLRSGIVGLSGVTDNTHDGGDVDDPALTLLKHDLARCLRAVEHPAQVEVDDLTRQKKRRAEPTQIRFEGGEGKSKQRRQRKRPVGFGTRRRAKLKIHERQYSNCTACSVLCPGPDWKVDPSFAALSSNMKITHVFSVTV